MGEGATKWRGQDQTLLLEAAPSTACGGPPPPQAGEDVDADYWMRVQVWVLHRGATMQPRRRSVLSPVMVRVPR